MNETIQKLKHSQYEPPQKTGDYTRCSGRVNVSCSVDGTRHTASEEIPGKSQTLYKNVQCTPNIDQFFISTSLQNAIS